MCASGYISCAILPVTGSSSTPYSFDALISAGSPEKKLPIPMDGSSIFPFVKPRLWSTSYIAFMTAVSVKCALSVLALALSYSVVVSRLFNMPYSSDHETFSTSNISGIPPHPRYADMITLSSAVAGRFSFSICLRILSAEMLRCAFCLLVSVDASASAKTKRAV